MRVCVRFTVLLSCSRWGSSPPYLTGILDSDTKLCVRKMERCVICARVWCKGSVAAVLRRRQDKVGHGEARAHRTAALQTALEGVGVSNGALATPVHGSAGGSLRHSHPTALLAHSQKQLMRSRLSEGERSAPCYLTRTAPTCRALVYIYIYSCWLAV